MSQIKFSAIVAMFIVLIASAAVLGCTSSSSTPTITAAPTTAPTAVSTAASTTAPSGQAALTINGSVKNPMSLTIADLRSLGVSHVNLTLNAHGNISYIDADAITLSSLLNKVQPQSSADSVTFIGSDGYVATVSMANVTADQGAVIALTSDQGLRDCIPTQASRYWVQNLTNIVVS